EPLLGRVAHSLAVLPDRDVRHDAEDRAALRLQLLRRALEPVRIAARDYHGGTVFGQQRRDRAADPAAPAGDDRHAAVEGALPHGECHRLALPSIAASAFSSPAGSSTESPRTPATIRRGTPDRMRPDSTSTRDEAPSAENPPAQSPHPTRPAACLSSKSIT